MIKILATLTAAGLTAIGAHALTALPRQAETTRAELAVAATIAAAEQAAALSPTGEFGTPAQLQARDPQLGITRGSPLTATVSARTATRLTVEVATANNPARMLVCAAERDASAVACGFTEPGRRGPWYALATSPNVTIAEVARGVGATSSYGRAAGAPIPGYSPEGF